MHQTLTSLQGSHRNLAGILIRLFQSSFSQTNRGVIRPIYQSGSGTMSGIRTRIHEELMRLRIFQFFQTRHKFSCSWVHIWPQRMNIRLQWRHGFQNYFQRRLRPFRLRRRIFSNLLHGAPQIWFMSILRSESTIWLISVLSLKEEF